ncbi:putative RNA polymerase sigma-70 factor, ECF subfamily [Pillotina sp. SPG140]|jgi:RNA polymerase sigma-70 factor (ECF subfamily)
MNNAEDFDDLTIIQEILAGQQELFRLLVRRYEQKIHAFGMSFFHNSEDTADFIQEVFLKVFRKLASYKGTARFSTWLYKVAYNTAINNIQRNKEYQSLVKDVIETETPEHTTLKEIIRNAVREAVQDLPAKYRICIDLFFFYDCSYQEIEFITGYPNNTIKSHVLRAKKILKEKLENFYEMS